ncbi:MAG: FCD domain-containing protein [Nitrospinaceae bacterium]|nr:FCD domain-containing protein [Nitrospinaceae bacterium]
MMGIPVSFVGPASGNERLVDLIENLRRQILKTRVITLRFPGRLAGSMDEHDEILQAILEGRERDAESLVIAHLEKQRQFVISVIRTTEEQQEENS